MGEQLGEHQEQIFPTLDIQGQKDLQTSLFLSLEDEIVNNPDIQSIGRNVFGSENKFFERYLSPDNRAPEHGIPDGFTKINALQKIQTLDSDIIQKGISVCGSEGSFYRGLLRYVDFEFYCHKYKTIPLLFSKEVLNEHIVRLECGGGK